MVSPLRILVLDDDPVMRELLEALLGYARHHVTTVDSGAAALSVLSAEDTSLNVILTDLNMPGLQGEALARTLKDHAPAGTLLLGMSATAPTGNATQILDDFLLKPFTPEQFDEAVARAGHAPTQQSESVPEADEPVLDEAVFARLTTMLPADQLRGLYDLTLSDVATRLELMKASIATGDIDAAQREAHAIKGGCGMVGARELHALAAAAETEPAIPFDKFTLASQKLKSMLNERIRS